MRPRACALVKQPRLPGRPSSDTALTQCFPGDSHNGQRCSNTRGPTQRRGSRSACSVAQAAQAGPREVAMTAVPLAGIPGSSGQCWSSSACLSLTIVSHYYSF